jgi:hypothetical protein
MSTLGEQLAIDESTPISFQDITKQLNGRVSGLSMVYVDLINHKKNYDLHNILGRHNVAAILLTVVVPGSRKQQRHWACLVKNKKGFFWFDSLAIPWQFVSFLKSVRAKPSTKVLQENREKIRTCGLWLVCRSAKFKLSNSEFIRWILSIRGSHPDRTVAMLCYFGMQT